MSASYQCIASSLRLRQSLRFQGDGGGDFRAGTNHQRQRARPQHRPPATVRRSMRERRSSYKTGSSSNFSPPPVTWIPSPQSSNDHGLWHTNSAISCAARLGSSESAAVLVVGIEFTRACTSSEESPRATWLLRGASHCTPLPNLPSPPPPSPPLPNSPIPRFFDCQRGQGVAVPTGWPCFQRQQQARG